MNRKPSRDQCPPSSDESVEAPRRLTVIEATLSLLAALIGWLELFYVRQVHLHVLALEGRSLVWVLLPMLLPMLVELLLTKHFESKRHGWRWFVVTGLTGRMLFLAVLGFVFLWLTDMGKSTPNFAIPLIGHWPAIGQLFWYASPWPVKVAAAGVVGFSVTLAISKRQFRLTSTVLLPLAITFGFFQLHYFHPTSRLWMHGKRRPTVVERVFPNGRDADTKDWRTSNPIVFARDLYVHPEDNWVLATFGSTFGPEMGGEPIRNLPNLLWLNLRDAKSRVFRSDTIRRFGSECSDSLFVAPWHGATVLEYRPGAAEVVRVNLPDRISGERIEEIMTTFRACGRERVYVVNNRNPVLFVWDTRQRRLERTVQLAGMRGIRMGDPLFLFARNAELRKLYLGTTRLYQLLEFDEESLQPQRFVKLPGDIFDIAVAPGGKYLYLPAFFQPVMYKLDAKTLEVLNRIPAPPNCRKAVFSTDGSLVFLGSYLTGEVLVFDAISDARVAAFYVTPKVEAVFATAAYLYAFGAEGIFRIPMHAIRAASKSEVR